MRLRHRKLIAQAPWRTRNGGHPSAWQRLTPGDRLRVHYQQDVDALHKGHKRRTRTVTWGYLIFVLVHAADIQDPDGAVDVPKAIRFCFPWLRHVFVDGGYADNGIRVNSVALGAIGTPMLLRNPASVTEPMRRSIPMQLFGSVEEIAAATLWLCLDEASYITEHVLPVEAATPLLPSRSFLRLIPTSL